MTIAEESGKTQDLLQKYVRATQSTERARKELVSAEVNEINSRDELAKHLVPKDAKDTEKFSIWVNHNDHDVLLEITKLPNNSYDVRFRKTS